jgi:hypothetical protein
MKWRTTIAMFAGLLLMGSPVSAQDQTSPGAQASPSDPSTPGSPPQAAAPQTPAPAPAEAPPQTLPPSNPPSQTPNSANKKRRTKTSAPGHKVVIRNGGAKDESAQLAPGMSKEQELHNRETTTKLLTATDASLKGIAGRPLTAAQQTLLDQIHTYIRQSKAASDAGDLSRAHTLAYKAHLLSDELKK